MSEHVEEVIREARVPNREGMHARPVMKFVDLASRFEASVSVTNITRDDETVDGKSAMDMILLEATQESVLRITARGKDAQEAADALAALVEAGFKIDSTSTSE